MSHPDLIFGAAFVGHDFTTAAQVTELLECLSTKKINRIDTARLYPITNSGASEKLLGEAKAAEHGFIIDTKIMTSPIGDGRGTLKASAIDESIDGSFAALGTQQVVLHSSSTALISLRVGM